MKIRANQTPEANEPNELNLFSHDNLLADDEDQNAAIIEIIKDGGIEVTPILEY
ncbi:hypothetical protein [Pseudomonas sp. RA_35y_Pfl2_P32]|uniref:hypothetical protein n=1 Tax=Pseudomonas sp. RA_35y_Pfl2_P32 TaxID=3088705 RepID=UPI0030DD782D